jgi:hypothetical protein
MSVGIRISIPMQAQDQEDATHDPEEHWALVFDRVRGSVGRRLHLLYG